MTPPCTSTCPDRSPRCHATCDKYRDFQAGVELAREMRRQEKALNSILNQGNRKSRASKRRRNHDT